MFQKFTQPKYTPDLTKLNLEITNSTSKLATVEIKVLFFFYKKESWKFCF